MKPRKKTSFHFFFLLALAVAAVNAKDAADDEGREGRIVVTQSFKTVLTTTTSTTSVPSTCVKVDSAACKRRRRRSAFGTKSLTIADNALSLDGSLASVGGDATKMVVDGKQQGISDREGRVAYSIWWTSTSTFTITSTSTLATTLTVSHQCSIVGATYPPDCP